MKDRTFLAQGKVSKLVIKLAIPTIIAQVVNLLYNIVDRIYIGHISEVGDKALTGVGVCMPIILIISAFAALIGYGGSPKASIYLGEDNIEKAEKTMGNSLTLLIILGLLLTTIIMIFAKDFLSFFGASSSTITYAYNYLIIYSIGSLFVMITLGMNSFISAQGYTKISMLSVLIGAFLNSFLDPIFIFVFNLGVKGAAIATVISQFISALFVIIFLCSSKSLMHLKLKNLKLDFKIIGPILALGLSPFIMQFTEAIIYMCFNASLKKYGGDLAVGAMTILSSLMQFSMLPLLGLAQGAQPVTSYNFGAKNKERVVASFKILLIVSLSYSFIFWLLLMSFPKIFASMFTNSSGLLDYSARMIRIYFLASGIFGIQIACQQTFIAIGNAKVSLFLAILRKIILLIPFIFILPLLFEDKIMAVYLAEPFADIIAVSVTALLFAIYFKKAIKAIA